MRTALGVQGIVCLGAYSAALSHAFAHTQVETIGDCFMAVAGLVPRRGDHAPAALRFALDMLAEAALVDVDEAGGRKVQLRVGLHAGPVTAGLSTFAARFLCAAPRLTPRRPQSGGRVLDTVFLATA